VASIRLFDQNGVDETKHVPIYSGYTTPLVVQLYRANGQQITTVNGGSSVSFSFSPPSLATATAVGDPMRMDITPRLPQAPRGV
jgi:hypothetical protein